MTKLVLPSKIEGSILAPPSKSQTIRAFVASLLAKGESVIINPSFCADALSALRAISFLGARIEKASLFDSTLLKIEGGFPQKNPIPSTGAVIACGESALALRLLAAVVSLQPNPVCLEAQGSLNFRPVDMIEIALNQLGGKCWSQSGYPPLWINGQIRPGRLIMEASRTSQLLSGLLFTLPLLPGSSEILAINLKSQPYIDLTLETLNYFGLRILVENKEGNYQFKIKGNQQYQPTQIKIEGDWSGAAFFIVAGALRGKIEILGLNPHSRQADRKILEVLQIAGGKFIWQGEKLIVESSKLYAFEYDAQDCPDLFPPLCVLALGCHGRSTIHGAGRLKIKESDRASALVKELTLIGAKIYQESDSLIIEGGKPKGGFFNAHGDHRLAMAGAIAGLISSQGIVIPGSEVVNKSFPDFFEQLKICGGKVI